MKFVGPSRSTVRAGRTVAKQKVAAPKGKSKESLAQFKGRVQKMSREDLLKETEDLLGDETI